jgi:hypothetical protein
MFSTLLMGGGGHTREKDHQNVKSLIIFAHDCSRMPGAIRVILRSVDACRAYKTN